MKELLLIRHGEADHLVGDLTGGWTDTRLTALGREQARLTGARLARVIGDRPFRFYASTLLRAAETAQLIAQRLPAQPVFVDELRELNNGEAAGRTKADAKAMELPFTPPAYDWVPYPGAESWRDMVRRVFAFLDRIAASDPEDLAVVVAHGNCGVAIVHWWLGLGDAGWTRVSFDFDPCSITHLKYNRFDEPTIARLNDASHLLPLADIAG